LLAAVQFIDISKCLQLIVCTKFISAIAILKFERSLYLGGMYGAISGKYHLGSKPLNGLMSQISYHLMRKMTASNSDLTGSSFLEI
jgi:hypothetical protein